MILKTSYDGDRESRLISTNPAESDVAEAVASMDWNRFAFVTLQQDDDNWLEGSGCLEPDFGLSMMLSVDGIEYVTESAPAHPEEMLELFNAYLKPDDRLLFSLIYDAKHRGLTERDVEELRQEEAATQRRRRLPAVLAAAGELFREKNFAEYVRKLEPFESLLEPIDVKKLSLARQRAGADSQ